MNTEPNKPSAKGLERLIRASGYSWQGLRAAFQHEAAFRLELLLGAIMLPLAIWIGRDALEYALLLGSLLLVLIAELINSALEAVVDRLGTERHPLSGRAKDLGSAAVLLALLNVGIVWGAVIYTKIYA